ncbi:MAG TPA: hypothetical protein VF789_23490 [Thermoanaerobaculia bacterium]
MTKMIRVFLLGLVVTSTMGSVSYADRCVPDPNVVCPAIFDPVDCAKGGFFSNACFAAAACARGCRPA